MATSNTLGSPYYFVAFGREAGDYLDLLGLPASATASEISSKRVKYEGVLKQGQKQGNIKLKEERDKGLITEEIFQKKKAELNEACNAKLVKLNEAKSRFDAVQNENRARSNKGHTVEEAIVWHEISQHFKDFEALWNYLQKPRPLTDIPLDVLLAIRRRWIDSFQRNTPVTVDNLLNQAIDEARELTQLFDEGTPEYDQAAHEHYQLIKERDDLVSRIKNTLLPSQIFSTSIPLDLKAISALTRERDLMRLLMADALWSRVNFTNRDFWRKTVREWITQDSSQESLFALEINQKVPVVSEFPSLSQSQDLSIEVKTELFLPPIDDSIEGTIITWLKRVGDFINPHDEILTFTVEDSAEMPLTCPFSGTLAAIKVREGEVATTSEIIAVITRKVV